MTRHLFSKKAGMFGLEDRVSRKQSSGLFLASLRKLTSKRLVAGQQATGVKTQRGGMFGLDARIAIVTFALIAGIAAYYGADKIAQTQDIAMVKQVDALRKAALQSINDNGGDFNIGSSSLNDNLLGAKDLTSGGLSQGRNNLSYISAPDASAENYISISTSTNKIQVDHLNLYSSTNAAGANLGTSDCAATATNCYYWLKLDNVSEANFALLESYYDDNIADYSNATATSTGLIIAVSINTTTKIATVLVKLGERAF